jgi:hypothetical protein
MRKLILIVMSLVIFEIIAQDNTLKFAMEENNLSIGMSMTIEALDYSNDRDKFNFDKKKIDNLIIFLKTNSLVSVEITCNSDYSEFPLLSMMSTFEQAEEIRSYMVRSGITGTRLDIFGNGEMDLLFSEFDKSNMNDVEKDFADKQNRRIHVSISKIKKENNRQIAGIQSYIR